MRYFRQHRSEQIVVANLAWVLFAFIFIPGVVSAQTKPLQVGGLPVT